MLYIPYLVILLLFGILFLLSRGFFKAAAHYLQKRVPSFSSLSAETIKKALIIVFAANLLGALLTLRMVQTDTISKGYLIRNEYGGADEETELSLEFDGRKQEVSLNISARKLSEEEIRTMLDKAEAVIEDELSSQSSFDHVDRDLNLPKSLGDLPVKVSWDTSNPLIMDWDGCIGEEVPEGGTEMTLTANLTCEEEVREVPYALNVFPRLLSSEEAFNKTARKAVSSANDETKETVFLPDTIEGKPAVWSSSDGNDGTAMLLLGLLAAAMYAYSTVRKKELEEEKREEQMLIDYPNIVSKLVLLLTAGMSLRKALARIRKDYLDSLAQSKEVRPGYEEMARVTLEMEHGISELGAYENLGKRCRVPAYRTFSTLLVQNLTKGGAEMASILSREAEEAFEERKKRARILGEQAGTKLLLPMLLMLVIVMVILMVPAFFAFF